MKDVGSKGLATISAETKALAKKARDGKLKPDEYQVNISLPQTLFNFLINKFSGRNLYNFQPWNV